MRYDTAPASSVLSEARQFVDTLGDIDLAKYRVVGQYLRWQPRERAVLTDHAQQMIGDLKNRSSARAYGIGGGSGVGKTQFVREVAGAVDAPLTEVNCSVASPVAVTRMAMAAAKHSVPNVCLIDEIDAPPALPWICASLLHPLDVNRHAVFAFLGSAPQLAHALANQAKGADLLSRTAAFFEIPELSMGDRVIIFVARLCAEADLLGKRIHQVEKSALVYVASNPALTTSRRIRDLARNAMMRMSETETRLLLANLFGPYDIDWSFGNETRELANSFVFLTDSDRVVPKRSCRS
jgi:hypothetical protein